MDKMKTLLTFLLTLLLFLPSIAQDDKNKENKSNAIYLEFYQPIQTSSLREFYNDDWLLTPSNIYSRHYFSNAIGICYERVLKNNIIICPRVGITIRTVQETNFTDKFNNGSEDVTVEEKFSYKQNHINMFFGIAKRLSIVNKFSIDLGAEIASVIYLNGNSSYYSIFNYYAPNTSDLIVGDERWWTNKVGKAYCFGIGPYIKPEYSFSGNISVSLELQMYFMYSMSKDKSTITDRHKTWLDPSVNGNIPYLVDYSSSSATQYDFRQWAWSRLSPLIRLGYKF